MGLLHVSTSRWHGCGYIDELGQRADKVRARQADPTEDKLSNESPIGSALVGHKRGDVVSVEVPRGPKRRLKITKIEAA